MNRKHWGLVRGAVVALCAGATLVAQAWTVGQVAPMSGSEASQGRAYAQGMRLYFDQVNKAGGVQGQPVELEVLDDIGHPDETVAKTRKLLSESKPVVLAGYFGNRNLSALLESKALDGTSIPLVGYQSTDTRVLASAQLFSTRAGLFEQMAKISTHLATVGITRLALVFEERPDAKDLTDLITKAVAPSGAKLVATAMVKKNGSDKAVQELEATKSSAQAILLVASSTAAAAFIEAYRMDGGKAQVYATAEADIEQLAKRLPVSYMSGLSIAQVVPSPYKVSGKLNKDFRDATIAAGKTLQVPVSFAMMEGFVNAKVIVEAMRRSQPVTPERVSAALKGIEALDLGGYWVNFKPGQVGSKYVDLSIVNTSGRVTQ
ncbi:ABC transporter substrate-binding protein [Comamonas sp. Y33R10-2]|uniref:ABC transporter substrate-binding protein n=1 Tax=Comamonas sp. Y33R10-2 TaxID=2853257 RepID=UPI001C5CA107|nr:ABC transporter substrate-binding protein [Comamonas sp. Y33R10-2]QXZ08481.1 ABC transporter substrate-binding protein [Comamonas sp. Y33R10-2]